MERPKTNWVERKNFISLAIEASSWNWFDKVSVECMQMALLDIGSSCPYVNILFQVGEA